MRSREIAAPSVFHAPPQKTVFFVDTSFAARLICTPQVVIVAIRRLTFGSVGLESGELSVQIMMSQVERAGCAGALPGGQFGGYLATEQKQNENGGKAFEPAVNGT